MIVMKDALSKFVIAELTRTVNSIGTIRALKNILIGFVQIPELHGDRLRESFYE